MSPQRALGEAFQWYFTCYRMNRLHPSHISWTNIMALIWFEKQPHWLKLEWLLSDGVVWSGKLQKQLLFSIKYALLCGILSSDLIFSLKFAFPLHGALDIQSWVHNKVLRTETEYNQVLHKNITWKYPSLLPDRVLVPLWSLLSWVSNICASFAFVFKSHQFLPIKLSFKAFCPQSAPSVFVQMRSKDLGTTCSGLLQPWFLF